MAQATTSGGSVDSCFTCSKKHSRIRPALCQCKHCSNSFCFDCMKEHHDDLHQNIGHASNQFNELTSLIKDKRKLVTAETIKSKTQMSEWLRKYISNLTAEKEKIDRDVEKAEQDAQKFVHDIEVQLQTLSPDIQSLTKSNIYSEEQMKKLLKTLEELIHQISSLTVRREYDLPSTMPKYKSGFDCSSKSRADDNSQTSKPDEESRNEEQNRSEASGWDTQSSWNKASNNSFPDEDYFLNRDKQVVTSYVIDCMASDGINIMYSTTEDVEHDIIAYCYLDINSDYYGQNDPSRTWLLPRIVDMIWWKSIGKFVCATDTKILTVEYNPIRFKILTVINDRWTDVRVAANTNYLWIHEKGKIMVYNVNFVLVRLIDFEIPSIITRESFCITDNVVAFLAIRGDRTSSSILQIRFYDINMISMRTFDVGSGIVPCMVRTDGTSRFFIAGGKDEFSIISSKGGRIVVALEDEANRLAVVNNGNIVFTNARSNVELASC